MYRYFLALRYLVNRPINLLGLFGVTVGVWALILVPSIFSGFSKEMRAHVRDATSDLIAFRLPWPCSYEDYEKLILSDENVEACTPRIVWYGLLHAFGKTSETLPIRSASNEPGASSPLVTVLGIDARKEMAVTALEKWLGQVKDPALRVDNFNTPLQHQAGDLPTILMSERRFQFANKGKRAKITSARLEGPPRQEILNPMDSSFRIGGAYSTDHTGFDDMHVLVDIDVLREFLAKGKGDVVTEIPIKCKDPARHVETAQRLGALLNENRPPRTAPIHVWTWEERNRILLDAVDHQKSLIKLVIFVIMVVASFLMYATLSMMVTEKTHDIGIITAMGGTRLGVLQVFLACGLTLVVIGTALGVVIGCLSSTYLDPINTWMRDSFGIDLFPARIYKLSGVPSDLEPLWIGQVALMATGLGIAVSGIPAWRASRHNPVEALRCE